MYRIEAGMFHKQSLSSAIEPSLPVTLQFILCHQCAWHFIENSGSPYVVSCYNTPLATTPHRQKLLLLFSGWFYMQSLSWCENPHPRHSLIFIFNSHACRVYLMDSHTAENVVNILPQGSKYFRENPAAIRPHTVPTEASHAFHFGSYRQATVRLCFLICCRWPRLRRITSTVSSC